MSSNKIFTCPDTLRLEGLNHLCSLELAAETEWLSDKEPHYWAGIDQYTGRPAHSKDSRSYFIAQLISPNSLYFISSSAFSSFVLPLFFSLCTALKVNRFLPPVTIVDYFQWKWFSLLFKNSLSHVLWQVYLLKTFKERFVSPLCGNQKSSCTQRTDSLPLLVF